MQVKHNSSDNSQQSLIGIFSGTFDPIHLGHINAIHSLLTECRFKSIHILPNYIPSHRAQTIVSAAHRMNMVELAISGYEKLIADDREIKRAGFSYSIDTIKSFKDQFEKSSLAFIVGQDAYQSMPDWKDVKEYLKYVHIIVLRRPNYSKEVNWGNKEVTKDENLLYSQDKGKIFFANSQLVNVSSTKIRRLLLASESTKQYLASNVLKYIKDNKLYAS